MKKLLAISLLLTLAALLSAGCQQNAQASNPEAAPEGTPVAVAAPEADAPAAVEANAPADADTVLAIVNGRQITEGTVQRQLELFKTQMLKGGISADQLDAGTNMLLSAGYRVKVASNVPGPKVAPPEERARILE